MTQEKPPTTATKPESKLRQAMQAVRGMTTDLDTYQTLFSAGLAGYGLYKKLKTLKQQVKSHESLLLKVSTGFIAWEAYRKYEELGTQARRLKNLYHKYAKYSTPPAPEKNQAA
jgi:hypothetical protein